MEERKKIQAKNPVIIACTMSPQAHSQLEHLKLYTCGQPDIFSYVKVEKILLCMGRPAIRTARRAKVPGN